MGNLTRGQRGGTVLGLIIGLVIGLAIAFVVALMITKSPAPLNKQSKMEKSAAAVVPSNNDPNQPMYRNKDAIKEASKDFVKEGDPSQAAKPEAPAADKASAAETKDAAGANKADDKWSYYLQAGAFKSSSEAEGMRARLALLGFEAGVSEMISQNGTMYRVRLGPYTQIEAMNRVRTKLAENNIEATVTRIPK